MNAKELNQAIVKSRPVVNLNGNSKESLAEEWLEFSRAISNVLDKFPCDSYHGRNQHVKGEAAHRQAIETKRQLEITLTEIKNAANDILFELS